MNYLVDIQNKNNIKTIWKKLTDSFQKHQNKFAYRKVQTNKWIKRANQNKDKFPNWIFTHQDMKLLSSVYSCCLYKTDWLRPVEVNWKLLFSTRFVSWKTCKRYKLCANCARLKANKNKANFLSFLNKNPELENKNRYYMVLTIRHKKDDDLVELFRKLTGGIDKIRQKIKDSKRDKSDTIFKYIEGAILSIEVTYGNNGRHPHCNFLFCSDHHFPLTNKWKTQINIDIQTAWKKITLDSDITSLNKVNAREQVYEVLKYITKFSELPDDKRLELHFLTKSFRFLRSWGLLANKNINESPNLWAEKIQEYEILFPTYWDKYNEKYVIDEEHFEEFNRSQNIQNPEMASFSSLVLNSLNKKFPKQ